jgi:hypothetical protein
VWIETAYMRLLTPKPFQTIIDDEQHTNQKPVSAATCVHKLNKVRGENARARESSGLRNLHS